MTGGRTATGGADIALEALVVSTPAGMGMRRHFKWESAKIVEHARREVAVIELAALLEVPIGVVRVLAADLASSGAVTITEPPSDLGEDPGGYTDLLKKVLDGIKSL
jgi:hypothetical protein